MKQLSHILYIAFAIYSFVLIVLFLIQERLIFRSVKLEQNYVYSFVIKHEEIDLVGLDGNTINTVLFQTDTPKGLIVYFHGNADNLQRWGNYAADFMKNGYNVLMVDYRTFGKSTGELSEKALYDDADIVYKYALSITSESNILLYGRSLGSGIATYIASIHHPKKLFLETPYYSLSSLALHYVPFAFEWLIHYHIPTYQYLKKVNCPLYIFHGTEDEIVPYKFGKQLFDEAIQKQKYMYTYEGAKHKNLNTFPQYHIDLTQALAQ